MKRSSLFIFFSLNFFSAISQNAEPYCEDIYNGSFQIGEKVTYKVVYNWNSLWLSAGEVSFTVSEAQINQEKVYHFIGKGSTYRSYDWFYKVRDTYESYVDKETLKPLKFVRDVYEGGYTIYNNVTFRHEEKKAISTNGTFSVPDCVQDVLSAIYYARNIDFSKYKLNDTIPVTIFLDDEVYPLYIRYLGKETIVTKSGKFNTIKFRPLLIEGTMFKGGEKMTVWVTDDKNKIPVLVESPIVVGSIKATLHSYEKLRHPLTGKIQ
jgi:hypothetical protein